MGLLRIAWDKDVVLRCNRLEVGPAAGIGTVLGTKQKTRWLKARPMPLEKADMMTVM